MPVEALAKTGDIRGFDPRISLRSCGLRLAPERQTVTNLLP